MKAITDRIRVPLFFVIMAIFSVFNPSKAMQLTNDILDGR